MSIGYFLIFYPQTSAAIFDFFRLEFMSLKKKKFCHLIGAVLVSHGG
jgi:hypothetical protein